jgi:hypothetical protein
MPQYLFQCNETKGGCGASIHLTCLISELTEKTPKTCPNCGKRKYIQQILFAPNVSIPSTIGSLADRNASKMSSDELAHIKKENYKYRESNTTWEQQKDGTMKKVPKIVN